MMNDIEASAKMNHIKVTDLGTGTGKNNHYYSRQTTIGDGQYQQIYLATTNSKTDWGNYAANLKTYITTRSLWFHDTYYDPTYCDHTYEETITQDPTCTETGLATYTCTKCGDVLANQPVPALGHAFNDEDGRCTRCDFAAPRAVITCSNGVSVTVYRNKDYTDIFAEDATFAISRNSDTGEVDSSGDGQTNFKVNLAEGYELVSVTAEPDTSYKNLKPPAETNVENGYRLTKVKGNLSIAVKARCLHNYGDLIAKKEPTCTESGMNAYYQCSKCNKYFDKDKNEITAEDLTIPALGHDLVHHDARAATCTVAGNSAYWTCNGCGKYFSDADGQTEIEENSWIIKPAHKWQTTYTVDKQATETTEGQKSIHCSICDEIQEGSVVVIPKLQPTNQKAADGTAVGPGASYVVAENAILASSSDEGPAGTKYGLLKLKTKKQTKTSLTLNWSKVGKATRYVLYGNKCGKANKMKKLATVTGTSKVMSSVAGQKVKKGTYYKFIIVAIDKNNKVVSTSKTIHVGTKGGKAGNHKSAKIKKSVLTKAKKLKKGKSLNLKAKAVKASGPKAKKHRGISYESTNTKIATVSGKGVVKARAKGTCYIYAYAQDGVYKTVKVVVK